MSASHALQAKSPAGETKVGCFFSDGCVCIGDRAATDMRVGWVAPVGTGSGISSYQEIPLLIESLYAKAYHAIFTADT